MIPKPSKPPVLITKNTQALNSVIERYEIVPCTVDPTHVRLIVYSGGKIDYTRRLRALDDAQNFARQYVTNADFRKSVRRDAQKTEMN